MANANNRVQGLTAKSATIIFITIFIAQLLCALLLYAIGGDSLGPLAEILIPLIGFVVMVPMAFRMIPMDLKGNDPTSAAWILGNWENLLRGLGIGCAIGAGNYFWNSMSSPHSLSNPSKRNLVEPISQMIVTPGSQQILAIILLVLVGPIVEEMMFRGILYGGYRKSFGPWWAAVITTVIFVAMHFPYYIYVPYKIIPYIVTSLALLWCRLQWKAIGPAITAHSGINIVVVVIPSLMLMWHHRFYELGVADYKASNFDQAITNLTRAIQMGDGSSSVYNYRGSARLDEGDLDSAISDYSKAIELDPNDGSGFRNRGLAKRRKADFEGAIADYTEAIALNPESSIAYEGRGQANVADEKLIAAMVDFDMAIKLNPTNSMYYYYRAEVKYLKGDFNSSIADTTRSIQLNPNVGNAYGMRGWARYQMGDVSDAVDDCNRAMQLFKPGSASFYYNQGLLDFIAKDYKKAIADWQNAIGQDPGIKEDLLPWIEKAQKMAGPKVLNSP